MPKKMTIPWAALAILSLAVWMAGMRHTAHAMPANPMPLQIEQPDGTTLQAIMRGDEFQGWMETSDGYTIVRNPFSKFYEYARAGFSGDLVPSGFVVSAAVKAQLAAQGLMPRKGLRPSDHPGLRQYQEKLIRAARAARGFGGFSHHSQGGAPAAEPTGIWAPVKISGDRKILLILVNFQDSKLSFGAPTYWSNALHQAAGPSVARYYRDNSFNTTSMVPVAHTQPGSPAGVVMVSLPQSHPDYGNNFSYSVESAWVNSALAAAAPYVNFPALDADGDGAIATDETLIYFIAAGYEAAAGQGRPAIWAHSWGGPGVGVSGKSVTDWAVNGEMFNATTRLPMGVVAHELGHTMGGLPDLYDISGNNAGLGIFSLMAYGGWGARDGETIGTTPVNLDAWSRQYLGWSVPRTPANHAVVPFGSALSGRNAPVMLMNSAISTSEYWLVENRPPVGWDAGMQTQLGSWTGGLLVQHIDLNVGDKSSNSFNQYVSGGHQGNMAVEPSTADCSLVSSSSWGCQKIFFYAGNSAAFNGRSMPKSSYHSGADSRLGISGVSAPGQAMTALVEVGATPAATHTLAVAKVGKGAGAVKSSPAGISCGKNCTAAYPEGDKVTLVAHGANFSGWSGACSGTAGCEVSMTAPRLVVATFRR